MQRSWFAAALLLLAGNLPAQQSGIFEFRNGFWVNLHQFLYDQAADQKSPASGSPEWDEVVAYYRREVVKHDLLDADMAKINNRLSQAGNGPAPGVDGRLAAALEKAAPEYRKSWWPKHDQANRAWIAAVRPLIARYGEAMKDDIAAAFQTKWPAQAIRTEVAVKAGWAGAYTTNGPTLITVSSTNASYQGDAALEMIFHEASHSLDGNVNQALSAELDARNMLFQRRGFSHAVLFYMVGEIARRHLSEYQPYGVKNGVLERGWPGALPVLERDWGPYLRGKCSLGDAVAAVVRDYGVSK